MRRRGPEDREQPPARRILVDPRVFQDPREERVENAGGAVGALDIPADPEQRLGDPAEHARVRFSLLLHSCQPWARGRLSRMLTSRSATCARPDGRDGIAGAAPSGSRASTQVSLDPPPWLEFTTSVALGQGHPGEPARQHPDVGRRR